MTGIRLEQMDLTHITEILEIEGETFPTPWTRGMFEQELQTAPSSEGPGSYAKVALIDECVAGYAVGWFVEGGAHLMNIAVAREFRRRKVGTLLISDLIETSLAAGKLIIILEVRVSNKPAQAFYEKFMFERFGVRRGYYADNREDAVLMALDLTARAGRKKRETRKSSTD
jgi:ribosomal-protein-alanine N-acetyltransferase